MAIHSVTPKKGTAPVLALAPDTYSRRWTQELVRQLQDALNEIYRKEFAVGNLPTTATGLQAGQMYVDANGFVKVVQSAS
jgi:hypothetical protein